MLIARSLLASLTTISDDIHARPNLLKLYKDEAGNTKYVHFRTENYYFVWTAETKCDSVIDIRQRGGCVTYKLYQGVPYSASYGNIIDSLSPREQERKKIAVDFIRQAILDAQKPVN